MEFFQDILPFLLFIAILIGRSRKRPIPPRQRRNTVPTNIPKEIFKTSYEKEGNEEVDNIEKETYVITPEELYNQNEYLIEEYINQERETFEEAINTPGVETKERIQDTIYKNEIGRQRLNLNKRDIVRGIVLSEILQRPKGLKR